MRSALAGRQRRVPLIFALLVAVIAGLFTFTAERGSAHAADTLGHDHGGPAGLPTAALNGSGVVENADITDVQVQCAPPASAP